MYDRSIGQMSTMKLLGLNVNDDYNYGMGGTDIVDQICGSYPFDHSLRNYKWWYSIFWWGLKVLIVNSYKYYCRYLKDINKEPMSHYVLQKIIALIWMDKENYKTRQREYLTR